MLKYRARLPHQRGGTADPETDPELEVCDADTAEEFLAAVLPWGDAWNGANTIVGVRFPEWIYRGHRDARWDLTPSALRPGVLEAFLRSADLPFTHYLYEKELTQTAKELSAVMAFLAECRRASVPVPEDGQTLRLLEAEARSAFYHREPSRRRPGAEFPPSAILSSFAIAQHHGVPTRLLDWSSNPLVAAYFAASGAAAMPAGDGRLAVWALLATECRAWSSNLCPRMDIVEAPHEGNHFLRAQGGVFTVVHSERPDQDYEDELVNPLEEAITYAWWYAPSMGFRPTGPWVRKLTLPWTEAGRVLSLLERANVTAATVFPGHSGVAQALRERLHHRQQPAVASSVRSLSRISTRARARVPRR